MQILLKNIKSIENALYEIPEKGIVRISGGNSNGKSILVDILVKITKLTITNQKKREGVIRDGQTEASVLMTRDDGRALLCKLYKESASCSYTLQRKNGETITRTFREGGLEKLLYEFGWRTYANNSVCLQIFETFGLAPFVNTPLRTNGEIVESTITDANAEAYIKNFTEVTYPTARKLLGTLDQRYKQLDMELHNCKQYDYATYGMLSHKLTTISSMLRSFKPISISKLIIPPDLFYMGLRPPVLQKIEVCNIIKRPPILISLSKSVRDINEAKQGKCPLCGRVLEEVNEHVS